MDGMRSEQVINGTWGEVWYDGEYLAELIACKAEISYKKTAVPQVKKRIDGQKVTGLEPKGELKFHHVNSMVMKKELEAIKNGKTPTHTIISNVADPDAMGAEKVVYYNCVLDKVVLADFEVGKLSERTYSFSFDKWDLQQAIN